jgi:arylformamidase
LLVSLASSLSISGFAEETEAQKRKINKGPLVWLNMDQAELDAAYDQSVYAPNISQVLKRYATSSELTRKRIGSPQTISYGASELETLDFFTTNKPKAPVHIFIHGGAWRAGAAKDYAFVAETFTKAGAHCVIPDFINVVQSKGDLVPMADQVKKAVSWVYQNATQLNADPNKIFISGHSSGAHLTALTLTTDWQKDFSIPSDVFKGALLCSGIYDLKPVRLSARSSYLHLDDESEEQLSPIRQLTRVNCSVIVAHGSLESPEFKRQSQELVNQAQHLGKSVSYVVGENYNHFEMAETLANPYGLLGNLALKQMMLI